jgi:hypothetical protein
VLLVLSIAMCAVLSPQMLGSEGSWLLALPDPCLLLVLQCFAADDYRSLFNAARAHSRLHQAAVRSITASVRHQQQMEGVIAYVGKHSQHVNGLKLEDKAPDQLCLRQLPQQLQLSCMQLDRFCLQLQPGNGFQGVLGAAATVAALEQLWLKDCRLLDREPLLQFPAELEHLSIWSLYTLPGTALVNLTWHSFQLLRCSNCSTSPILTWVVLPLWALTLPCSCYRP